MENIITILVDGILVPVLGAVVVPLGALISLLATTGILLLMFAGLWLAFGVALVRDPSRVDRTWTRLRRLPLIVQAAAWLLFLPVLAGAWIWRTTWPPVARYVLIAGVAVWNLLVFLPRPT